MLQYLATLRCRELDTVEAGIPRSVHPPGRNPQGTPHVGFSLFLATVCASLVLYFTSGRTVCQRSRLRLQYANPSA